MSERKGIAGSDWAGIALFAVGVFGAVLMCRALSSDTPLDDSGMSGAIAAKWVNAIGLYPSLAWNAAIAFLGARLFLQGPSKTLVRNIAGVTGSALALSIVFGALSPSAGGTLGQHTGRVVADVTHFSLGVLVGLVVMFAVAWFTWLRSSALGMSTQAPAMPTAPAPTAAPQRASRTAPERAPAVKTTVSNEGVSAAESAALFPLEEVPQEEPAARKSSAQAPSPYPEDVRRLGQIPPGARPLENRNAVSERQSDLSAPAVYRWTAARPEPAIDGAGANLAPAAAIEDGRVDAAEELALAQEAFELNDVAPAVETESARVDADAAPVVPVPSWEEPDLFEAVEAAEPIVVETELIEEDEPVDAYGTPLSLVEKLRRARQESGLEPASDDFPGDAEAELTAPAPFDPEIFAQDGADDADEVEDDLFDDDELEEDEDEEEDDEEDAEYEAAAEIEEDADEPEVVIVAEAPELEHIIVIEPPSEARPAAATVAQRAASEQPGLFDQPAIASETTAPSEKREPEHVLQPQPTARTEREPVAADADSSRQKVLAEIGCLFVERGRVAVSMLQRQYSMDFDEACKVLDDLQEMGLIGPYLGGQRRDILLTREQWLERVSKAGVAT